MLNRNIALAALVVLGCVFGCGGKPDAPVTPDNGARPEAPPAKPAKLVVGVLLPLTGPDAAKGQAMLEGLKLAIKQKGAGVALDESSLEVRDCGQPMSDALGLARALVDVEGAGALVGPLGEKNVEAVDELGRQKRVPILTPASGAMKLGILDCTVRRLTFTAEEEGQAMAELAAKKGYRQAAAFVDVGSAASEARVKGFVDRFQRLGGRVISQVACSPGDGGVGRFVRMAAYQKPDAYYLAGARADSAAILEEMKSQKVLGAVLGSSEWDGADFPVEVSAGADVFVPCRFFTGTADSASAEFVRAFKAAHEREPDAHDAFGYDAGITLIDALMRGGNLAERVDTTKLLPGATGRLTARAGSLAGQVTLLRLKGNAFEFDSVVDVK